MSQMAQPFRPSTEGDLTSIEKPYYKSASHQRMERHNRKNGGWKPAAVS
jgi:hypothetical protein